MSALRWLSSDVAELIFCLNYESVFSASLVLCLVSWRSGDAWWFLRPLLSLLLQQAVMAGQGVSRHVSLPAVMCVCVHGWWIQEWRLVVLTSSCLMPREEKLPNLLICYFLSTLNSPELTAAAYPVINNCTFGILDTEIHTCCLCF